MIDEVDARIIGQKADTLTSAAAILEEGRLLRQAARLYEEAADAYRLAEWEANEDGARELAASCRERISDVEPFANDQEPQP